MALYLPRKWKQLPEYPVVPSYFAGTDVSLWCATTPTMQWRGGQNTTPCILPRAGTAFGPSIHLNNNETTASYLTTNLSGASAATWVVVATPIILPTGTNEERLVSAWSSIAPNFHQFFVDWYGSNLGLGLFGTNTFVEARYGAGGSDIAAGRTVFGVFTWNAARVGTDKHRCWINGSSRIITEWFSNGAINTIATPSSTNAYFGVDGDGTTAKNQNTHLHLFASFPRDIGDGLAQTLSENPLLLIKQQPRRVMYFGAAAGATTTTVTPAVGSIVVAGNTPTLITNTIQQPSAGSVIVTGNAPTVVENLILQPSSGTVVVSGFAPTLQIGADTTVQPGVGSVVVAGLAPTLLERYIAQPAAGSVVVSGLAPSLKFEQRFNPETGTVVVSGLAPTVVQNIIAQPGAGTIVVEGLAPNAGTGAFTTPGAGAIVVAGLAPTVTATEHVTFQPDAGQIIVSGLAPTVIDSGLLSAEQLAQLYGGNIFAGKKKKKKKKPELEEMVFEVAKTTAGKKEIIHVLPKKVQEEFPDPQLALVSDLVQKIEAASERVKKEVERIHKKRRDDDEDDIFILLM